MKRRRTQVASVDDDPSVAQRRSRGLRGGVIHPFIYHSPRTRDEAASHLAERDALPLGGGTDLLVLIDEQLARPSALVDLRRVEGLGDISDTRTDGLRIGASTRIDEIARNSRIAEMYPALVEACAAVGTPALRQMGTIGGNLCQRPRCWYFRRGIPCLKNGGTDCPAYGGENQYHAIVDGGPCFAVHPSDPAVALTALDCVIEVTGHDLVTGSTTRRVPIEQFYVLPTERVDRETNLANGEFVSGIILPADAAADAPGQQRYTKVMQRGAWDFALVSLAAVRRADGDVRLVLGGVAPRPWRVARSVEEEVASHLGKGGGGGGGLDDRAVAALAERALQSARPLSKNQYKVELASSLLRRGIREITA